MTPDRWEKVGEIFGAALELDGQERSRYLEVACTDDADLRAEIESLLNAGAAAGQFISQPVAGSFIKDFADHIKSLSPGSEVGKYKIEKAIGFGGMGEVYLAVDQVLGRQVALKTLPPALSADPQFVRRFRTEAQAAANINHPNVATVYSVEDLEGLPIISMEYVGGQTLDHLIPDEGLDLERFLAWFEPLAGALAHAHGRGITHRDIKPGNIMISDDGTPKMLDFGLAQIDRGLTSRSVSKLDITAPGQVVGTPAYMSPEQAEGSDVDARSDIFSFGTVMYEALSGTRPFRGPSHGEVIRAVIDEEPVPVGKLRPGLPPMLGKLVAKCLQKSPERRFRSMVEVHSVLRDVRIAIDSGLSMDSFARRFYREATSASRLWWVGSAALVLLIAFGGWYYFSAAESGPPIDFEGMTVRKLSQSNNIAFAAIAPDGRSIVYVTYEDNGDRAMWLRRVSDSNAIQIVPPQPVQYWDCPAFSNDGEYVYFITAPRAGTHGTMYRVPTLGGQPRRIVDTVNHFGNLSPDGRRVMFVRYGETRPTASANTAEVQLLTANSDGSGDERVILRVEGETIVREPRFSPDGRTVYFVKRELVDDVEYWSVMSMGADGGEPSQILKQRSRIGEIAPLTGSNGLIVNAVDPATNRRQLFYLSLPGGRVNRITNDVNSYVGASVDRAGRNIVAAQRSEENRVWAGGADGLEDLKPVTREPIAHQGVDWTPNGRVVFDGWDNSRRHIWIADADGKNPTLLTPAESDDSEPHVSGDGRFVVFTSHRAGFNQIWRMSIDGSGQTLLADVPGIAQYPRFEADGETVVFRWYNRGSAPLGRVSVRGGPATGIEGMPRSIAYFWASSPDGRYYAFTSTDPATNKMYVIIKERGSDRTAATLDVWPFRIFKWLPDSSGIYYQDRQAVENPQSKVFKFDIGTRRRELLFESSTEEIIDLTFSPDGEKAAMVRGKPITDAVMFTAVGK